jgi:hypothetical protein
MMTKQEERQALKKIEKILAEAGEDSYIGMAFAGCCKIALDNIENDFGNSLQESLNTARENMEREYEMRQREQEETERLQRVVAQKCDEIEELRAQLKAEKAKQIPAALYRDLWLTVEGERTLAVQRIALITDELAAFADCPRDIAVANCLQQLKAESVRRDKSVRLLRDLEQYEPTNA